MIIDTLLESMLDVTLVPTKLSECRIHFMIMNVNSVIDRSFKHWRLRGGAGCRVGHV
jgi:hypothetical protein